MFHFSPFQTDTSHSLRPIHPNQREDRVVFHGRCSHRGRTHRRRGAGSIAWRSMSVRRAANGSIGCRVLVAICVVCILPAGCKNRRNGESGFDSLFGTRSTEVSVQRPPTPPDDLYGTPVGVATGTVTGPAAGTVTGPATGVATRTSIPLSPSDPKSVTLGGLTRGGPPATSSSTVAAGSVPPLGNAGGYGNVAASETQWEVAVDRGSVPTNRPLLPPIPMETAESSGSSGSSYPLGGTTSAADVRPSLPNVDELPNAPSTAVSGATTGTTTSLGTGYEVSKVPTGNENVTNSENATSENSENSASRAGSGGSGVDTTDTGDSVDASDTRDASATSGTTDLPDDGSTKSVEEEPVLPVPESLLDARQTDGFEVIATAKTIRVILRSDRIFEPQSAEWISGGRMYVESIMEKVFDAFPDRKMMITGHMASAATDTARAETAKDTQDASDAARTLSATRASEVAQMATDVFKKPVSQFEVKGLGDSEPAYSTGTPDGTQANERIEIVVLGQD